MRESITSLESSTIKPTSSQAQMIHFNCHFWISRPQRIAIFLYKVTMRGPARKWEGGEGWVPCRPSEFYSVSCRCLYMLVAYVIVGFAVTVTVNELLIQSLTLKNFYTCRLARLISPVGSLWIYCKRFLPDFFASWFWKSRKTASHILANTVSWSCEPSVSWFAVYRMCVTKKVTHFSRGFRLVLMF